MDPFFKILTDTLFETLLGTLDETQDFLALGGPVLVAILLVSLLLWTLILERYWYLFVSHRRQRQEMRTRWLKRADHHSWCAKKIRERMISESHAALKKHLILINTLTKLLPLLGLLGTVSGMIETFEVMTRFGMANPRGMADGISQALLTTMAGLVTAVAGFYFSIDLSHRAKMAKQKLGEHLVQG